MLTDAEIETIAQHVLNFAVLQANEWKEDCPFYEVRATDQGELVPVYGGTSPQGYGSFLCEYMPLAAIKKLVVQCEQLFDAFRVELTNKETGEVTYQTLADLQSADRQELIKVMAETAGLYLIAYIDSRLKDALVESFLDAEIVAQSFICGATSEQLKKLGVEATANAVKEIETAALRVADKKREYLRDLLRRMPNMVAERKRGAPPKSESEKQRARTKYKELVEEAYRSIRLKTGSKPTKISVARKLGEGGINPKTGTDSSLQAFRLKCIRYEVDYDEITQRVENELNNK